MCIFCTDLSCHKWFPDFFWSRAASPQLIQRTVRINRFCKLGSVHKIHINLEATSPLNGKVRKKHKGKCVIESTSLVTSKKYFLVH